MTLNVESLKHTNGLDWSQNPFQKSTDFEFSIEQSFFSGLDSFFDINTTKSNKPQSSAFQQPLPPTGTDFGTNQQQTPPPPAQGSRSSLSTRQIRPSSNSRNVSSLGSSEPLSLSTPETLELLSSFSPNPVDDLIHTQGQSSIGIPDDPESSQLTNFQSSKSNPIQTPQLPHESVSSATDKGYWIKRLTDLNIKLFEHSDAIPALEV